MMVGTTRSEIGIHPAEGLVEVSGRAHDVPAPLTAPVSGADCLSYTLDVEEYRRHDEVTKEWVDVSRIERGTTFVLTDDTGTVTIDPEPCAAVRCDIAVPERDTKQVDDGVSPGLEADIAETGDREYPRRYRERHLSATHDLYVLGTAVENGTRIANCEGQPFIISTDSEHHTVIRHATCAFLASVVGAGLLGWGSFILLQEVGVL